MKRYLLFVVFTTISFVLYAQSFQRGDMVADINIGVGLADVVTVTGSGTSTKADKSSVATFTQKLSFEYGVLQFGNQQLA